jgi:exopolysaccharide biosynthesis polyprenyl glycosylphosphotransferase
VFSRQSQKIRVFLQGADLLLVWLAFEAAYSTRAALPLERLFFIEPTVRSLLVLFSQFAWLLAGISLRVYPRLPSASWLQTASLTIRQAIPAGVGIVLFSYIWRLDLSRPFLGLFAIYTTVFTLLFRAALFWAGPKLSREFSTLRFVYVAGTGESARRIAGLLGDSSLYGIRLSGFLDSEPGVLQTGGCTYPVHPISGLSDLLQREVVDEIVFTGTSEQLARWEDVLLLCDEVGVRTRISADFFPHVNSRIYLDRIGGIPLLTFAGAPHDDLRLVLKRATDLVLSSLALLILSPLLVAIAAAIRLTSPGPAIFRQQRCGLNGRRFTLYKFRTMGLDAEARKAELTHLNTKDVAFKIPNDPRITPLGRWLRKFSVDELPQFWNVVRGEMSLVGPRPPVPEEVANYERWQRRRLRMRPGLTCLWALAGRDELSFEDWMRLDLDYIDSWSLALDWSIMLRTIPHVLTGRGAS